MFFFNQITIKNKIFKSIVDIKKKVMLQSYKSYYYTMNNKADQTT